MIHIIKMGQIPMHTEKFQSTCHYCSTVFEYDKTDIQYVPNGLDLFYYGYVACPLCKIHSYHVQTFKL